MNRAALVVIDVQESFRQRPIWAYGSNPDMVQQVDRLVTAARERGDLVVWVLHSEPGTGTLFDPALGYVRLLDGLTPVEGEPTLVKTAHNAFTTTNLQQLLTQAGIVDLTVCGIRTEQCVETTTRVASDLGYRVTFVTDATLTFPIAHWDLPETATLEEVLADPRTLSNEEIVARTEYALAGRFATIRTVDELTGTSLAGARA
ncbi:isochorismatase family protein [Micromonospora vulcania]|uniref:Isochorismatase family protein n=1 Tax=Micromonospora vulcania TaxID=1441873 RepID=A0ABW1HAY1_9ACTN